MANNLKFSKEEIEDAKKAVSSFTFSPDEIAEAKMAVTSREPTTSEKIETAGRGVLSGMSFGASEPVVSGINALIGKGIEEYFRRKEEAEGIPQEAPKSLGQLYDEDVEKRRQLKDSATGANIAGELAGAISPGGAAGLVMKGAKAAFKGAGLASKLGKVAPIAQEAFAGASMGAAQGLSDKAIGEASGFVLPGEKDSIGTQAMLGGSLGAVIPGASAVVKAVGSGAKGAMTTFFGVRPEVVTRFLANPEAVMNAKSPVEITELAQRAVEKIKQTASVNKLDLTDDVATGLGVLKKQIMDASENAYSTLEMSDAKVAKNAVISAVKSAGSELEKFGNVGPSVQSAKEKIANFANDLAGLPDDVDGVTLKRIVKSLDDDLTFLGQGEFAGSRSQAVMLKARGNVDELLKSTHPAYREAIKPVRDLAQFHDEVFNQLKTPEKVFTSLTKLGKPGQEIKDQKLEKFFKQTNIDQERFRQAQADADMFQNWDKLSTAETKVKSMMGERSEAIKTQFKRLSELSGTDFIKEIENIGTKSAFEQEFLRGSRNVNLWGVLGGGAGAALGAGVPGAIVGGVVGSIIDKKGPQIAQQVLAGYSKLRGTPTVAKIRQVFSELPKDVVQEIEDAFIRSVVMQSSDVDPTFIPAQHRKQVSKDISEAKHLSPTEKAKMIKSLNKFGEVPAFKRVLGAPSKSTRRDEKTTLEEVLKGKPSGETSKGNGLEEYMKTQKETF